MFAFHCIRLIPAVASKVLKSSFWKPDITERVDTPSANQKIAFFKEATLVYSYKNTDFFIGSAFNAVKPKEWFLHVNCCASEITIRNTHDLYLEDTDYINLRSEREQLDAIVNEVKYVLDFFNTPEQRKSILFNCWVGASRSVGCLIYVLELLIITGFIFTENVKFVNTKEQVIELFDRLYASIKEKRPCVCISKSIRENVIEILTQQIEELYAESIKKEN